MILRPCTASKQRREVLSLLQMCVVSSPRRRSPKITRKITHHVCREFGWIAEKLVIPRDFPGYGEAAPEWTLIFVDHNVMITFHIMALHSAITREDLLPSSKVYEFEMFRKCTIFADSFDDRSGLFCGARSMDQFTQLNLNNTSPFLGNGAVFRQLNETIQLSLPRCQISATCLQWVWRTGTMRHAISSFDLASHAHPSHM